MNEQEGKLFYLYLLLFALVSTCKFEFNLIHRMCLHSVAIMYFNEANFVLVTSTKMEYDFAIFTVE